jgi:hypothetical protein
MSHILSWIRRVPTWVWLFLAATQVLTILRSTKDSIELNHAISRMSDQAPVQEVRIRFGQLSRERHFELIASSELLIAFAGCAIASRKSRSVRSDCEPHL